MNLEPATLSQNGRLEGVTSANLTRPIWLCAVLLVASAAVFYLMPGLDLIVSRFFYWPEFNGGNGFFLGHTKAIVTIRTLGMAITVATFIGLAGLGLWWQLRPESVARWPSLTPKTDWWFVMTGLLLGPGAMVSLLFKPFFGRPRPVHIEQFGGHDHFTPAWVVSRQCEWNCSFVSGEAAAAAFFFAFWFVVPPRWRRATFAAGVVVTLADSFARVAAGGHFLSDVVTSWILIGLMLFVLRAQFYYGALLGPLRGLWVRANA